VRSAYRKRTQHVALARGLYAKRIEAGLVQPFIGPNAQVHAGTLFLRCYKVFEFRYVVGVFLQVRRHAAPVVFRADQVFQLLQNGRALLVGDGVENAEELVRAVDRHFNRVRRHATVTPVCSFLGVRKESVPGILEFGHVKLCQRRHLRCKTFVQPQAVPPVVRHQVAKPHVRHLVKDYAGSSFPLLAVTLLALHVALAKRHRGDVFHRAAIQLAAALALHQTRFSLSLSPIMFVSADKRLNEAAKTVGMVDIKNPNDY
jgi:hypothetical protein